MSKIIVWLSVLFVLLVAAKGEEIKSVSYYDWFYEMIPSSMADYYKNSFLANNEYNTQTSLNQFLKENGYYIDDIDNNDIKMPLINEQMEPIVEETHFMTYTINVSYAIVAINNFIEHIPKIFEKIYLLYLSCIIFAVTLAKLLHILFRTSRNAVIESAKMIGESQIAASGAGQLLSLKEKISTIIKNGKSAFKNDDNERKSFVEYANFTLVKVLCLGNVNDGVFYGVYLTFIDGIDIYEQKRLENDEVLLAICYTNNNNTIPNASNFLSKNKTLFERIKKKRMRVPFDGDIKKYKRINSVPCLDIYGKVHDSYNQYICSVVHDNVAVKSFKRGNKKPQNLEAFLCDDEGVCSITKVDGSDNSKRIIQHGDNFLSSDDIINNTERFKEIMKKTKIDGNGGSANVVEEIVAQCIDNKKALLSLMNQISPDDNFVVKNAKKLLTIFSSLSSWVSPSSDLKNPLQNKSIVLELKEYAKGTNMKFGKPIDYDDLKRIAKPGDMIAAHGFQALSSIICSIQSKVRKCMPFGSHVGFLVDTTVLYADGMEEGEMYLMESSAGGAIMGDTNDAVGDIFNLAKHGCQIRSMRNLLIQAISHNSLYILCPLNEQARAQFDANVGPNRKNIGNVCVLKDFVAHTINAPYTTSGPNFTMGVCNGKLQSSSSKVKKRIANALTSIGIKNGSAFGSEFFCSELVGAFYTFCGILNFHDNHGSSMPPNNIHELLHFGQKPRDVNRITKQSISSGFIHPRQLYPIDFFLRDSHIPYLFNDLHVIQPTEKI